MRLIDADAVRGKIEADNHKIRTSDIFAEMMHLGFERSLSYIDSSPTVDHVRHGKWVTNNWIYGAAYCSECNYEIRTDNTKYCPNCGSKMDGE